MMSRKTALGLAAVAMIAAAPILAQPPTTTPSQPTTPPRDPNQPTTYPTRPGEAPDRTGQPDRTGMKKAMEEASKPGENHAKLNAFVGDWEASVKDFSEGPRATESKATVKNSMIMGGRFLKTKAEGTMNGEEFDGHGVIGFNNITQQYESCWICNESTSICNTTGTADSEGKVFTFTGQAPDPLTKKMARVRQVWRLVGPEKYTIESYMTDATGKENRIMEISLNKTGPGEREEHGKGKDKDRDRDDDMKKRNRPGNE